jgi:hypothetical protein
VSPRLLEGTAVPDLPRPKFFMGCLACKWLEARIDVVEICESGRHRARRMEVKYTCETCRWTAWCSGPVKCSASKSHRLTAESTRPAGA